jgi:hypothetical protein
LLPPPVIMLGLRPAMTSGLMLIRFGLGLTMGTPVGRTRAPEVAAGTGARALRLSLKGYG